MQSPILQKYLEKINYSGDLSPTLNVLSELQFYHLQTFAFENLTPFCGETPKLDTENLADKFLNHQRGGYCFEQNLLFKFILEELGFRVKGLSARVLWHTDIHQITRNSHMLLFVELDGKEYLTDVGFGGSNFTSPLKLVVDKIQKTRFEDYKITNREGDFILQVNVKNDWKPVYRFNTNESFLPDYEVYNWYLSNHPKTTFVNSLMATKVLSDKRLTLHNHIFKTYLESGEVEVRELKNAEEIVLMLEDEFELEVENKNQFISSANRKIEF